MIKIKQTNLNLPDKKEINFYINKKNTKKYSKKRIHNILYINTNINGKILEQIYEILKKSSQKLTIIYNNNKSDDIISFRDYVSFKAIKSSIVKPENINTISFYKISEAINNYVNNNDKVLKNYINMVYIIHKSEYSNKLKLKENLNNHIIIKNMSIANVNLFVLDSFIIKELQNISVCGNTYYCNYKNIVNKFKLFSDIYYKDEFVLKTKNMAINLSKNYKSYELNGNYYLHLYDDDIFCTIDENIKYKESDDNICKTKGLQLVDSLYYFMALHYLDTGNNKEYNRILKYLADIKLYKNFNNVFFDEYKKKIHNNILGILNGYDIPYEHGKCLVIEDNNKYEKNLLSVLKYFHNNNIKLFLDTKFLDDDNIDVSKNMLMPIKNISTNTNNDYLDIDINIDTKTVFVFNECVPVDIKVNKTIKLIENGLVKIDKLYIEYNDNNKKYFDDNFISYEIHVIGDSKYIEFDLSKIEFVNKYLFIDIKMCDFFNMIREMQEIEIIIKKINEELEIEDNKEKINNEFKYKYTKKWYIKKIDKKHLFKEFDDFYKDNEDEIINQTLLIVKKEKIKRYNELHFFTTILKIASHAFNIEVFEWDSNKRDKKTLKYNDDTLIEENKIDII